MTYAIMLGVFVILLFLGAPIALSLGTVIYKKLKWKDIVELLYDTAKSTGGLMLIIGGATIFSYACTRYGISTSVQALLENCGKGGFLVIINIVLLIAGCFMDANSNISVCLDPVMNQAAKLHYMTGGQVKIPMVIRAPMGTGRRGAAQHSQNMEALFAHIPGLKLVCPSTPADAKGLLMTAIRDDDPVVFLEHKLLYPQKVEMPDDVAPIPLGSANIRREGTDLTILTWARQVNFSLEAAEKLAADGVSAEVIDLRSLVPLDWDTIRDSVSKTHRVLIAEEDVKRCGFGAELSAQIMEELFDQLDAPVRRVAALNSSVPFCAELEDEIYPNPERIAAEAAALLKE